MTATAVSIGKVGDINIAVIYGTTGFDKKLELQEMTLLVGTWDFQ